jgi:hypothetical protein
VNRGIYYEPIRKMDLQDSLKMNVIAKYGFIFIVGSTVTVGGICGLIFLLAPIFGTLR